MQQPITETDLTEGDVRTEEVDFRSGGESCAGTLYHPPGNTERLACVVMANGVTLTRRDGIPRLAERFARAGFVALAFDFRHLGESGGEPRQLIDYRRQHADTAAAVAFARSIEEVDPDRVAIWGFSLGGGIAVYAAADDPRLAAVIASFPFLDGLAATLEAGPRRQAQLTAEMLRAIAGRRHIRMPITGPPGSPAVLPQPEAMPGFEAVRADDSLWRNDCRVDVRRAIVRIRPVRVAHRIRAPFLACLGERDTIVPLRAIERAAARAPRGELRRYPIGHFDGLLDAFDEVANDQVAFLTHHLAPVRAGGPDTA